jgi:predicted HicB family RNase H-like nuclease
MREKAKYTLRMPKVLSDRISFYAKQKGISVNRYIVEHLIECAENADLEAWTKKDTE